LLCCGRDRDCDDYQNSCELNSHVVWKITPVRQN
jgi:hypothetical protein